MSVLIRVLIFSPRIKKIMRFKKKKNYKSRKEILSTGTHHKVQLYTGWNEHVWYPVSLCIIYIHSILHLMIAGIIWEIDPFYLKFLHWDHYGGWIRLIRLMTGMNVIAATTNSLFRHKIWFTVLNIWISKSRRTVEHII